MGGLPVTGDAFKEIMEPQTFLLSFASCCYMVSSLCYHILPTMTRRLTSSPKKGQSRQPIKLQAKVFLFLYISRLFQRFVTATETNIDVKDLLVHFTDEEKSALRDTSFPSPHNWLVAENGLETTCFPLQCSFRSFLLHGISDAFGISLSLPTTPGPMSLLSNSAIGPHVGHQAATEENVSLN